MHPAIVSGIVTGEVPVNYWSFFPCPYSLVTVPQVFAKVNSNQFRLVSEVANCCQVCKHKTFELHLVKV